MAGLLDYVCLFGYDQGVFSGLVVTEDYLTVHGLHGRGKTDLLSTITSIYAVDCLFGVPPYARRSRGLRVDHMVDLVSGERRAEETPCSIGNGISTATVPVWQTETSQAKWRGKLVVLEMMMNISGFTLVNWVNYGLSFLGGAAAWRAFDDPYVIAARDELVYSVQDERNNAVRWRDLVRRRNDRGTKTLRRLLLGIGLQAMQQFGGISIMSRYGGQYGAAHRSIELYVIRCRLRHRRAPSRMLYPTEINSLPMRTKGAAAATMSNWITNFCVVEVTPIGLQMLGWPFYIVWTVLNATFIPIIWLLFPKTGA
ncbi:general substrate transporter [Apiospora arundinis]